MYKNRQKYLINFVVSLVILIVSYSIFLIVFTLLAFANQRKSFFFQLRPAKNERIFKIIKFKTMNAEQDIDGNLLPDSQRLTKIGEFLRKTSLIELPRFFKVLKGDMAIIGQRPLLRGFLTFCYETKGRRHEVKSGITG